ncbi:MAG TPA: alkaline phosphatase family protein [Bryobacteraceae bacterium]|nr:alkaline phosphatase family protein [Bryobacteraceae bacterium]
MLRTLLACVTAATALTAAPTPKIVVAIVIDQFRYDYLLRFRSDYNSGFARLLEKGAVFTDAHYLHAATVTAVGHSTFLTGATPSISGIVANEWLDRESGQQVTSVSDPTTKLVGGIRNRNGSSPRRLLVSTVGDELKVRFPESKVVSVSIKDRSAILPGGHSADGAYWYDNESAAWVTSSYYHDALPDWVKKLNKENPQGRYLGSRWLPFDAKNDAAKPFCTLVAGGEDRFCGSIEATPWGNELIEEFAERALEGENLGRHASTDVLAVSFSSNDYVGHALGPDDPAVRDISIRTDRLLGKLFEAVEKRVGAGNMLVVLTADHGVAPVPEVSEQRKMPGGRLNPADYTAKIQAALNARFGEGKWFTSSGGMLYFNRELMRNQKVNPAEVERVAAEAAMEQPHIARVYTRSRLANGEVQQDSIGRAFSLGFFPQRSGDLFTLQEPYYLFDATGTTHGTPYNYDNHVPILFLGAGIKAGSFTTRVAVNDIAPTLAEILKVEQPSGSVGRILREILE